MSRVKTLSRRVHDGEFDVAFLNNNEEARQILADLIDLEVARANLNGMGLMKSRELEMIGSCVIRDPTFQNLREAVEEIDTKVPGR